MKKAAFIIIMFLSMFIYSEDYIQRFGDEAFVNWTKNTIQAIGKGMIKETHWSMQGKIDAHRAASLDAMRNLLIAVNKINVDSNSTVQDFYDNNQLIKKKVSGTVKNFTEKNVTFSDDGICEVTIEIPINGDGSLSDIFLGKTDIPKVEDFIDEQTKKTTDNLIKKSIEPGNDVIQTENTQEQKTPEPQPENNLQNQTKVEQETKETPTTQKTENTKKSSSISGLVVNTHQFNIKPALNPKILTEAGEELYSYKKANRDFRRINGLTSYAANMNDAKLDKRVTEKPFVMDATSIDPEKPCVIIVKEKDAKEFLERKGSARVIEHCRVIIVNKS